MKGFKTGSAAKKAQKVNEKKIAEANNRVFRFYLPDGSETKVTFLDGNLNDDGLIEPMFWEHQMYQGGNWKNWYMCTQDEEPCPLCEGGSKPYLVVPMTVIDHTEWTDSKKKKHKNERKLFMIKHTTQKVLTKQIKKRKGLYGVTFEISRDGDQSPSVGNSFDYVGKSTKQKLTKMFTKENAEPFNYEKVFNYMPAKELRKMGFGVVDSIGGEGGGSGDFEDDMD